MGPWVSGAGEMAATWSPQSAVSYFKMKSSPETAAPVLLGILQPAKGLCSLISLSLRTWEPHGFGGGEQDSFSTCVGPWGFRKEGSFPLLSKIRSRNCVSPLLGWAGVACRVLLSIRELPWHSGFVAMVANTAQLCCFTAESPHVREGFATALAMMLFISK